MARGEVARFGWLAACDIAVQVLLHVPDIPAPTKGELGPEARPMVLGVPVGEPGVPLQDRHVM